MLPARAHDAAPIMASEGGLLGGLWDGGAREAVGQKIDGCVAGSRAWRVDAAALERIGHELIERKPHREVSGELVVDHLEGESVVRRPGISPERIEGLRVEGAVADIAVAPDVAHESRALGLFAAPADDGVVVQVSEVPAVCTENWIRLDARQRLGNPAT